jgi:murein DD-endopeptidase MepM/ murein hydrolase activator NlpD
VGHNRAVPVTPNAAAPGPRRHAYPQRPPGRARRRHLVRLGLVAGALGLAALVVVPAVEQATRPTPLKVPPAQAAAAQEPSSTVPPTAPPAAARPSPTPEPVHLGAIGVTSRPAEINPGVPPSRLEAELTGTTAPNVSILTGYTFWPLAHPRLTLPYGATPWGEWIVGGEPFHDGIDIATFCGDHVRATHDGVVLAAGRHFDDLIGWVGDLGPYYRRLDKRHAWSILPNVVVIDDGNGYRSMYAHFAKVVVRVGQRVKAGQLLGYEGATGHASGCHVHYGIFSPWETGTFRLDPAIAKRMKVPAREIARIDPRRVLPPMPKPARKPAASDPPPTGG